VCLNKMDTAAAGELCAELRLGLAARKIRVHPVSAATGRGIPALLEALGRSLASKPGLRPA
jgi:50S ribosomal subunit-associated GTPase HflX